MNRPTLFAPFCFVGVVLGLLACSGETDHSAQSTDRLRESTGCPAPYEPCAEKACGERCSSCPPNDPSCGETAEIKVCHADGSCHGGVATCEPTKFEPCAGKACGDTCDPCAPNDPSCVATAVPKFCHADGTCDAPVPVCNDYDPCRGKTCGAPCTLCAPNDASCVETGEVKQCDAAGKCQTGSNASCM